MKDLFQFFPALDAKGMQRIEMGLQGGPSEFLDGNSRACGFFSDHCGKILRSFDYRGGGVQPNTTDESIEFDDIVQILVLGFLGGRAYVKRSAEPDELRVQVLPLDQLMRQQLALSQP